MLREGKYLDAAMLAFESDFISHFIQAIAKMDEI